MASRACNVLQRAKANKEDREAADQVSQELDKLMKLKEERAAAERRYCLPPGPRQPHAIRCASNVITWCLHVCESPHSSALTS